VAGVCVARQGVFGPRSAGVDHTDRAATFSRCRVTRKEACGRNSVCGLLGHDVSRGETNLSKGGRKDRPSPRHEPRENQHGIRQCQLSVIVLERARRVVTGYRRTPSSSSTTWSGPQTGVHAAIVIINPISLYDRR
jgi:hypothetical protein